jgi:uncharacterized protein YigA (DUF484 family)
VLKRDAVLNTETDRLTEELVADYLRDNPTFFLSNPELVERIQLPHHQAGTVSLVQVQLNRQRQRIEELEEEITALMSLAASNDHIFHEFMVLHQQMFSSRSLLSVIKAIELKACDLNLKAHVRLIDSPLSEYQLNREHWLRFKTNHLNGKSAYLGRIRQSDRNGLFGIDPFVPEMGSYVVLPIKSGLMEGLLAFSSADGGHFQPSMDTLFLRHLVVVLSFLIETIPWHE